MNTTAPRLACSESPWSTWIEVRGPSRVRFLQGLCSNDVEKLPVGQGCEAFFPTVQGKVLAHVVVLKHEEAVVLAGLGDQTAALMPHLEKYGMIEDVTIRDRSRESSAWLLWGENAESWIGQHLEPPPGIDLLDHGRAAWDGLELRVFRTPLFAQAHWELRVTAEASAELAARLAALEITRQSFEMLEGLRVASGFPRHGVDISADHLAQEVNRDQQAISFRKGCYLGQETVARIDALGHVNKKLVQVRLGDDWQGSEFPQAVVLEGKEIGQITSLCESPGERLGLAMIRRSHNRVGTRIISESGSLEVI